jgi:hypothetical protein
VSHLDQSRTQASAAASWSTSTESVERLYRSIQGNHGNVGFGNGGDVLIAVLAGGYDKKNTIDTAAAQGGEDLAFPVA